MSRLPDLARFASQVYGARLGLAWRGHVRRDAHSLLQLGPAGRDPYPLYAAIRREPLVPTALGNWATARHDVCSTVLRDRRLGVRLLDDDREELDLSFLELDPPDHTRLRRLAAPAFASRQVASYRPRVDRAVHAVLDDAERKAHEDGGFDLVPTVASALPVAVIASLLGVPETEVAAVQRHGAVLASGLDGVRSLAHAKALLSSNVELARMFERVFAVRRERPGDDVISMLLRADREQLRPEELVPMCTLLLVAGFETTVNLVGNGTLALLRHPDQWAMLRDEPALVAAAVEEMLRHDPPVQRTSRVAGEDLEVAGVPVRRGQVVVTHIGGANRDPAAFADPDRFDVTRETTAENLAFAGGIHYCLGAPLARLEAVALFTALLERMPALRLAGRPRRRPSRTLRGLRSLPVALG